jgi:hypothetical protein
MNFLTKEHTVTFLLCIESVDAAHDLPDAGGPPCR